MRGSQTTNGAVMIHRLVPAVTPGGDRPAGRAPLGVRPRGQGELEAGDPAGQDQLAGRHPGPAGPRGRPGEWSRRRARRRRTQLWISARDRGRCRPPPTARRSAGSPIPGNVAGHRVDRFGLAAEAGGGPGVHQHSRMRSRPASATQSRSTTVIDPGRTVTVPGRPGGGLRPGRS